MCVCDVRKFGPVGSLLILTIYNNTSVCAHTHAFVHRQGGGNKRGSHTNIVNKSSFFFIRVYKTALPQCVLERLYGVTTALEKSNINAITNVKCGIKKVHRIILQSLSES